ncbi:MAG TPA: electron transfer flavoprotein subunit beta [Spirochaetia bacterium]|nr:electron transfer flavoprotein subunit beta [Spirochaetia bacterium]
MKIAVCLKQVPDTLEIDIEPETGRIMREKVRGVINPYDLHALEEAVKIKETTKGRVFAFTMGPQQSESILREALSKGADEGFLLSGREFAGSDTLATSKALAEALRRISPDIIICGKQAVDGDTAQVGPGIAAHLDIPFAAFVSRVIKINQKKIIIERLSDSGKEILESVLPFLMTVVRECNTPRPAGINSMLFALSCTLKHINASDLGLTPDNSGLTGSPTSVASISVAEHKKQCRRLSSADIKNYELVVNLAKAALQ